MSPLPWILLGSALVGVTMFALAFGATLRHLRVRTTARPACFPPVSMLKPLKGVEENLADNLRTFYRQRYAGSIELIFATTDLHDAALPIARAVASEHPHVPTRFVVSDAAFGRNPKVANLAGAIALASHDLVLQTDANVRIAADYLERAVAELLEADAHLSSSLAVGVGERSLGAALHNVQLSAFVAPACCLAFRVLGMPCVIGKSMLFRRRDLARVGGIARVRDVLAEDFVLGQLFRAAGMRVILSTTAIENVNIDASVEHFFGRHARWLKMRAVVHVPVFVADAFVSSPATLSFFAFVTSGFDVFFGACFLAILALKTVGDALVLSRTRGARIAWRHLAAIPLRDFMMIAIWPYAAFSRSVEWRGVRLRIGKNTLLRDDASVPNPTTRRSAAST